MAERHILTGAFLQIDPPKSASEGLSDPRAIGKALERWVIKMKESVENHKDFDGIAVVCRQYVEVCTDCGEEWEPTEEGACSKCGST